jgi:hypothetical protein
LNRIILIRRKHIIDRKKLTQFFVNINRRIEAGGRALAILLRCAPLKPANRNLRGLNQLSQMVQDLVEIAPKTP